ncbi:MAG TPA: bifunctional acetate--CoA ligase family protein/GNAT family N-acetyltransferase [Rhodanobacteraceae bacterium]|nr:bifunctional acetate--CoA ligase family protein/GNAT family N-acetyltransferase [Rhodanobacteraceae bacterium]
MSTYNLAAFMQPASVALVGASRRAGSVGAIAARNLAGFGGEVFLINRNFAVDVPAGRYPTVAALPRAPELAIVAVPAAAVPGVIADLGRLGTRAAVVLSAGFSETQAGAAGAVLREEMLVAARATGLRILGPNCVGMLAPRAELNAGFAQALPLGGGLTFLSQSGAVLTTLIDWANARGVGFSALVSLGEMAEVDVADWLDYLATDAQTHAILLYLESVPNARKFMSAARHAARLKPVIALKSGRSPAAAKAAASHSGALAGSDAVFDAAFRRAGIQRVATLTQMLETAETLSYARPPAGERLALVTNGGGMGVLAVDQLLASDGTLAKLDASTMATLDAALPAAWSHANPVDIIGDAGPERYRAALDAVLGAEGVDAVAVMYCPTGLGDPVAAAAGVAEALRARPFRPPVLAAWLGPAAAAAASHTFAALHVPNFDTPEALVRGFLQLDSRRRQQQRLMQTVPAFPLRGEVRRGDVRRLIDGWLQAGADWLDEADAKHLLAVAGFPVNESRRAKDPDEARAVARDMQGPYAIKILSPDLLHKSEVGGVALNIESPDEVARVTAGMLGRLREAHPQARINGVSVQRMVDRANAQELIAGLTLDPVFGPVIVFGAGGVTVEAVQDTAIALPPLDINLARELVERTRIARVLKGANGRVPPADLDALLALLIRLSELVCEFPEIVDLDLNPILAGPGGVTAIDARVRLRAATGSAIDRLAIVPYPRELERPFELPDSTRALLRPIRPEDELPLRRAFERLSPESRYLRMFDVLRELPHALAARATQIDYDREMAFVISEDKPAGEAVLYGGVRLISDANRERGEFAITVIDDLAGHGIGRRLMHVILDYARGIGVRVVTGAVLANNRPMLALCRELGFHLESPGEGIVEARLELAGPRA